MSPNTLMSPDFAAAEVALKMSLTTHAGAVATRPEIAPAPESAAAKEARFAALRAGLAKAAADTNAYFDQLVPYALPDAGYPYIS